jgi:hypothetical protein
MGTVLARDVHVTENGIDFVVLPAGKAVPKKYAKLVTNKKAFIEVEDEVDADAAVDPGTLPYDKRNVNDLRDLLKGHELPTDGKKPELVARLLAFDAENAEETLAGGDGESGDGESDDDHEE